MSNTAQSDTQMTDAAAFAIPGLHRDTGFDAPPKNFVKSDFARQLERELNEEKRKLRHAKAALISIASFPDGPTVNSSFDEPSSARIARIALNIL